MFGRRNPFDLEQIKSKLKRSLKADVVSVTNLNRSSLNVELSLTDYLYADLKTTLEKAIQILQEHKCTKSVIRLNLANDVLITNGTIPESKTAVEILEAIKSRLPSAQYVTIDKGSVSFEINDLELFSRSALNGALVLVDHFNEELPNGSQIKVTINKTIEVTFEFAWLQAKVVNETIINSVRYYEMMEFLQKNPHPEVETFSFKFRDSSKGYYTELNIIFKEKLTSKNSLQVSEFIRSKLNERFSHLPVY
jgi:hypothetical protein